MITKYAYKNVTWVDVVSPTREDIRTLMSDYGIHPTVAEELVLPTVKSKVDAYESFIYLVLHFPAWKIKSTESILEIDFIIAKDYLITVRYDSFDSLHKFAKMLEVNTVLGHNEVIGRHGGYLFFYVLRELYKSLHDELDFVKDALRDIERQIFSGEEKNMIYDISHTSRELLTFKHATSLHDEILGSFEKSAPSIFPRDYIEHMQIINDEQARLERRLTSLSESLAELRETNNSLLESKQNKIISVLTIVTFITSNIAIFISLFAMNTSATPIVGMENDFWILLGLISAFGGTLGLIFKRKKWL